jgi:hypothetical protein
MSSEASSGSRSGDVVEVAPQYDPTTVTAQAGAQMLFQLLCLMVLAPSFRARGRARVGGLKRKRLRHDPTGAV